MEWAMKTIRLIAGVFLAVAMSALAGAMDEVSVVDLLAEPTVYDDVVVVGELIGD